MNGGRLSKGEIQQKAKVFIWFVRKAQREQKGRSK